MSHPSDAELVEEVRKGKRRAFTELMRRYQERVYWVARRIVGNHADADDITQETFIKAYLALGEFRGDSTFFTWIYRIATNLSLNTIRKHQVMNYLRQSDIVDRLLPSGERPDKEYEQKEAERLLQEAIAKLPEKQKAVFVLRYFDGLSYEEISQVMKTSVGGLKANYFHAVRKVQEFMKDEIPGKTGNH